MLFVVVVVVVVEDFAGFLFALNGLSWSFQKMRCVQMIDKDKPTPVQTHLTFLFVSNSLSGARHRSLDPRGLRAGFNHYLLFHLTKPRIVYLLSQLEKRGRIGVAAAAAAAAAAAMAAAAAVVVAVAVAADVSFRK